MISLNSETKHFNPKTNSSLWSGPTNFYVNADIVIVHWCFVFTRWCMVMNQWPSKFPTLANVIFGKHDEVWWLSRKRFLAMWQILLAVQQIRFGYVTNNCWLCGKYFLALWQIWRISEQQAAPNVRPCVSGGVQIPAPHSHVCPAVLSSFVTPYTLHAFAHTEYFPRLYSVILVRIIRTLACSSLFGAKLAICRRVTSHARESQYVRCSETSDTKVHPSI